MKALHIIAFILIIVGGINWGLVGLFDFNLVMKIFGSWMAFEKLVYILVGLAALFELVTHKSMCKMCAVESKS